MKPFRKSAVPESAPKLIFLDDRVIRAEKKYTESSQTLLEEQQIVSDHFIKLREFGVIVPSVARVIGPSATNNKIEPGRLMLYGVVNRNLLYEKLTPNHFRRSLFAQQVIEPLTHYFEWAFSSQEHVLTDLVHYTEDSPTKAWGQFSYDALNDCYVMHDVDTELEQTNSWVAQVSIYNSLGHIAAMSVNPSLHARTDTLRQALHEKLLQILPEEKLQEIYRN